VRARIEHELNLLYGDHSQRFAAGIKRLADEFVADGFCARKHPIWSPGENRQKLYFNAEGVLAEYAEVNGVRICHRTIQPFSFFWSEKSFLLWQPSDTSMFCLKRSSIYSLDGEKVRAITQEFQMGFFLANRLSRQNIQYYRERSRDLGRLNPLERLEKTILADPQLLNHLSRSEMASYLGLSRSSLFRAMNSLHRGN
jgi:CRP-like cAMP-binding protein